MWYLNLKGNLVRAMLDEALLKNNSAQTKLSQKFNNVVTKKWAMRRI